MLSSAKKKVLRSDGFKQDFNFFFFFNLVAIEKLESLVILGRLKRIVAAWRNVAKDSKKTKDYFKVYIYLEF